ncbi:putative phage abortive infection protein [Candidatus Halocynthiibacter alkanivorans]|uniref:putative phage abortive infection protein n=1 Tax=Candidatus Halocynthiibacter alkanivorans TaxID=2267619 RepID=UPI00109CF627|nr:putative phage abortive infection protein [Candidatus Halocynthiibacter alkanivorans]
MEKKAPGLGFAVVIFLLVIILWVGNWFLVHWLPNRGTFGDMFGAVNSLFTGLAFAAVIYAILLQRHEVDLLKTELKRSKSLLEKQQDLATSQLQAQEKQIFEATFFQFLEIFVRIVESMDLKSTDKPDVVGKDVFPVFLERIRKSNQLKYRDMYDSHGDKDTSESAYEEFYSKQKSELGHYFRTLYNLFKFVDKSDIVDKRLYTNLIRAQLSDDEAMLLFMNGLSRRGEKFKKYLEEYAVLKNVDETDILYKYAERKKEYSPSAFE